MLIVGVLFVLPSYLSNALTDQSAGLGFLIGVVSWVLQIGLTLGLIAVALKVHDNQVPPLSEVFNHFGHFFTYFGASLLYGLIMLAGIILLVVPAFVWALKYSQFAYFIVDKDMGPMDALHQSGVVTKGAKWRLFGLGLSLMLINLAGALVFLVGLLVTVPMTMLAYVYVYRKLSAGSIEPGLASAPSSLAS